MEENYAVVVAFSHFAFAWGSTSCSPGCRRTLWKLRPAESQLGVAAVPYVLMMCSALSAGILADALLKKSEAACRAAGDDAVWLVSMTTLIHTWW